MRLFPGIEPIAISLSCKKCSLMQFQEITRTCRSSFRSVCEQSLTDRRLVHLLVSKVTHFLSYRRNIVELLSNTYTFEKVRGSLIKYEGVLKSFRSNKDTRLFSENFLIFFQYSLCVNLHTSPSDAPISITRPNSTRRFSLQNNYSRR